LGKGDVASIGEGGDDESDTVSGVFKGVESKPIDDSDDALHFFLFFFPRESEVLSLSHFLILIFPVEFKLRKPRK
jgi:hypothetical protein